MNTTVRDRTGRIMGGGPRRRIRLPEYLAELRYANKRFWIAAENSSEMILDYDLKTGKVIPITKETQGLYGLPDLGADGLASLREMGIIEIESQKTLEQMAERLKGGEKKGHCVIETADGDGEKRWWELSFTTLFDNKGMPERAIGVLRNITQLKETEQQIEQHALYRDAMEKDALLFYEADLTNHRMISGVEKMFQQWNIPYSDNYEGALFVLVSNMVYQEDQPRLMQLFAADYLLAQHRQGIHKVQIEYRRVDEKGSPSWVRGTARLMDDPVLDIVRVYYYVNDVHKEKMEELKLREKAERDLLTGLYNKGTTEVLIKEAAMQMPQQGCVNAFFIVDLDNFKNVNDQMGHAYGDAVLSESARKMASFCRTGDIAGRVGGDEFAMYMKNVAGIGAVQEIARSICQLLRGSYATVLKDYKTSGTVGVSIMPHHGMTFEELYLKADLALYEAKGKGKDTWCIYQEDAAVSAKIGQGEGRAQEHGLGKTFSGNMIEYIFRILYEAEDVRRAIDGILELIAKHFGFLRGYIYENNREDGEFEITHEWYVSEELAAGEGLRRLGGKDLQECRLSFEHSGSVVARSATELPLWLREFAADRGIQFSVQYALMGSGQFTGFMGFDASSTDMVLHAEELSALQGVMQLMDIFLAEKHGVHGLEESGTILEAVTDGLRACTYIVDPETYRLYFVNQNTRAIIGEAVPGTLCYETVRGRGGPCSDCPISYMSQNGMREYQTEMYLDRYQLWANINASMIRLKDGRDYGLFNGYDFTEYKKHSGRITMVPKKLSQENPLYQKLGCGADDFIYMCDMIKEMYYFPKAMVQEFALPGQIVEDGVHVWAELIHSEDKGKFEKSMEAIFSGAKDFHSLEYRVKNKDGIWVWVRGRGYMERDAAGRPALFTGVVTNLGRKNKIDQLSGLPDKYEFENNVKLQLERNLNGGALLLLDLDNFKYINNFYGWEYGDEVLREAGQKLKSLLPERVQLYRLDSDKFGVFFPEEGGPQVESFYYSLHRVFQRRSLQGEGRYYCTVSGGYAVFLDEAMGFDRLLKQAEFALEYSKAEGKNRLSRYDSELMSGKDRGMLLIARLQESIDNDFEGFELYFQPQIEPRTHTVKSAEALLRWNSREFGAVPPDEFVPLLEQSGLIQPVGKWVLLKAAEACRDWRRLRPDFTVNINVSFAQFQDKSFFPYLTEMVEKGIIEPKAIHLGLTESCIASGSQSLTEAFRVLRELGFSIEMDDFGTGYSSLEILKNAPADVVKIDHAFVMDITKSDFDATFIRFIVSLCHSVGIKVCLEGVETWAEYYMVEPMELDLIQGFLFGRPQSRREFENRFLKQRTFI